MDSIEIQREASFQMQEPAYQITDRRILARCVVQPNGRECRQPAMV